MTDERSDIETLPASDDARADEAAESEDTAEAASEDTEAEESPATPDEETPDLAAAGVEDESGAPTPAEQVSEAVTEEASEAIGESDPAPETTAEGTEALAEQAVEEVETVPEEQAAAEAEAHSTAETPAAEGDAEVSDPQAEITESEDPETAARSALGLGEKIEEEGLRPEEAAAILEAAAREEEEAEEPEAPDLEDADLVDVVEEEPSEPSPYDRPGDWYVVHTYSGYEKKVKSNVESRVKSLNMEGRIHEVVIPMDDVIEFKGGKKTVVQKKVFPGYLLVRMTLDDNSWGAIRNTPGVTGFVGSGAKPTPLSRKEVESILRVRPEDETKKARPRLEFEVGDQVRVTAGPFADFNGLIDEINVDQSTLKVLVNIFGRETPVTLEFSDVAKL